MSKKPNEVFYICNNCGAVHIMKLNKDLLVNMPIETDLEYKGNTKKSAYARVEVVAMCQNVGCGTLDDLILAPQILSEMFRALREVGMNPIEVSGDSQEREDSNKRIFSVTLQSSDTNPKANFFIEWFSNSEYVNNPFNKGFSQNIIRCIPASTAGAWKISLEYSINPNSQIPELDFIRAFDLITIFTEEIQRANKEFKDLKKLTKNGTSFVKSKDKTSDKKDPSKKRSTKKKDAATPEESETPKKRKPRKSKTSVETDVKESTTEPVSK